MSGRLGETVPPLSKPRRQDALERDFDPCPVQPIVYGPVNAPVREAQSRILGEKITELAFCQNETCRVTRERDALTRALGQIAAGEVRQPQEFAREVLARLSSGELRKSG